jgi:uncharacterized membrane protein
MCGSCSGIDFRAFLDKLFRLFFYAALEGFFLGDALLAAAIEKDWKGKLSLVLYLAAIPLAFVSPWIANGLYVFVALLWLVPDRRIERVLVKREKE